MTTKVVTPAQSDDGWAHITLNRNDWYVRFYLWLYDADPTQINTCKLFWAYVFAPVVLPVMAVVSLVMKVGNLLPKRKTHAWTDEELAAMRLKRSQREEKLEKWTTRAGSGYARIVPALRWAGIGIGVLAAVAAVGIAVYGIVADPIAALIAVGVFLGMVVAIFSIAYIVVLVSEKSSFFQLLGKLGQSAHRHTCAKVKVQ